MVGKALGHYEILELLGKGGMGEVYRARDTKLDRDVAIKVLPEDFATDPDRLARIEREAKLLASLNHTNIAVIYGLEDEGDQRFIAMELVEGETLAGRISRSGGIEVDEALYIARQIAEALEAAHANGVIHRDLKPANVVVAPDGKVKVLDFGLAKALDTEGAQDDLTHSPTATVEGTKSGVLLGTVAYMSPEQARGQTLDTQTDIWSFACVLYEMLAARKAFSGETVSDTLAAILKEEPDWSRLPEATPEPLRSLLARSLQKDARQRLRDIGDARIEVSEMLGGYPGVTSSSRRVSLSRLPQTPMRLASLVVAGALVAIIAAAAFFFRFGNTESGPGTGGAVRVPMAVPGGLVIRPSPASVAISLDGRQIVISATAGGDAHRLYLRAVDQLDFHPLEGTARGTDPFFSPDGSRVGFHQGGVAGSEHLGMLSSPVGGGAPTFIGRTGFYTGASWGEDDSIFFGGRERGLGRVPATGGTPEFFTEVDRADGERSHGWPHLLPGGRNILFAIRRERGEVQDSVIVVESLETGLRNVVIEGGTRPLFLPSGHLVYSRDGTLMAAPFDLDRLETTGPATTVLDAVLVTGRPAEPHFTVSDTGILVYRPPVTTGETLMLVDHSGGARTIPGIEPGVFRTPRFSPDGQHLVYADHAWASSVGDLWLFDIARETLTKLTTHDSADIAPVWSPDGEQIAFSSQRDTFSFGIYVTRIDGSGEPVLLTTGQGEYANTWSPEGTLLFQAQVPLGSYWDLWQFAPAAVGRYSSYIDNRFQTTQAAFSPDGKWVAYTSNQSGEMEVYVRPYPGPGERIQISNDGGRAPVWSPEGQALYYRQVADVMRAAVQTDPEFSAARPQLLFESDHVRAPAYQPRGYDISADGESFVMIKPAEQASLIVIFNWFEELKELVPTGRQ